MRPRTSALLLVLVLTGCATPAPRVAAPSPPARPFTAAVARAPGAEPRAVRLLRTWDERRADAWATGSPARLRDLYLPSSGAGRADVRRLRAYRARGLVVRGMTTQLLAVRVLRSAGGVLRLAVTDRLARAVAARPDGTAALVLPRGSARQHTVTLVRSRSGWRVGEVSGPGRR